MVMGREIVWDASKVALFWKFYSENPKNHGAWMSEGSRVAINKKMKEILPNGFLSDPKFICDWGCGTGNFAKAFVAKGHKVFGLDQDVVVSQIPTDSDRFVGISDSSVIKDEELDLIYALEVIEHIIDSEIQKTFGEWRRVLKKNGYLLLTTPNEENLKENSIFCPNCETQFHSVQHVRSLSTASISKMLNENGFKVEKVWLGEFFFATKRGLAIEILRKIRFGARKLKEIKNKDLKQPHMMVLCKLK